MVEKDLIGFIKAGKYRLTMLREIEKTEYITPKELSEKLDMLLPQVSRTLSRLSERNLIKCTTPKRKKGRIYQLTEKGKEVLQIL